MQNSPRRLTRRTLIGASMAATPLIARSVVAQDTASTPESTPEQVPIQSTTVGDVPSQGGYRPGPLGTDSPQVTAANPAIPTRIIVDKAGINADIEQLDIVGGVMENPTGPWTVSWYRQTATLGEPGNVVLAGHVDYWNVGPSVFFNIRDLAEGDIITLVGEDERAYNYAVEWSDTFLMEDLTSGKLAEVVGTTDDQVVTLITCGGEFDYVNGEYLSRMVVRGRYQAPPPATPGSTPGS